MNRSTCKAAGKLGKLHSSSEPGVSGLDSLCQEGRLSCSPCHPLASLATFCFVGRMSLQMMETYLCHWRGGLVEVRGWFTVSANHATLQMHNKINKCMAPGILTQICHGPPSSRRIPVRCCLREQTSRVLLSWRWEVCKALVKR